MKNINYILTIYLCVPVVDVDNYFKDDMFLLGKLYSQIVQKYKKSDVNLTSQFRKILKYYNKPKPVRNSKVKALLDQLSNK